jgi:hypothetical protein
VIGKTFSLGEHLTLPVEERVLRLVASMTGIKREELVPTARLFHDLHVYGDDADELLMAIKDEFGVDFSGFEFSDYFTSEPNDSVFWQFVTRKWVRKEKLPFTVSDLVEIVKARSIAPIVRS